MDIRTIPNTDLINEIERRAKEKAERAIPQILTLWTSISEYMHRLEPLSNFHPSEETHDFQRRLNDVVHHAKLFDNAVTSLVRRGQKEVNLVAMHNNGTN